MQKRPVLLNLETPDQWPTPNALRLFKTLLVVYYCLQRPFVLETNMAAVLLRNRVLGFIMVQTI